MPILPAYRLVLPVLLLALTPSLATAQSTAGNAGAGETMAQTGSAAPSGSIPAPPESEAGATRDILTDAPPALAALTTVGKSSDGTTSSTPASAALAAALSGSKSNPRTAGAAPKTVAPAPLVPVKDASVYPYRTVGVVELTYGDKVIDCIGFLIGPSTVATSASCLWGALGQPVWTDKAVFFPGASNGHDFGAQEWSNAYVMQGFIDGTMTATSDGTLPFGIGMVVLKDPVGDKLGWLGFQTDLNETYSPKSITYGSGDDTFNMQTTSCTVDASTMYRSFAIPNPCPAADNGSPLYVEDAASKAKYVTGVKLWTNQDGSSAESRISAITYEWLTEFRK